MPFVLSTLLQAHERVDTSKSGNNVDRSILASAATVLEILPLKYLTSQIQEAHNLLESILEHQENEPPLTNVREIALTKIRHAEYLQVLQTKESTSNARSWTGTDYDWDTIETAKESPDIQPLTSADNNYYRRNQRVVLRSMGMPTGENLIKEAQSDSATFGIFYGNDYAGHFFVESPRATPNERVIVHAGIHAAAREQTHTMVEELLKEKEFSDVDTIRIAVHLNFQWLLEGLAKNGFRPDRLTPLSADHFGGNGYGDDAVLMHWQRKPQKLRAKVHRKGPHRLMEYFPASKAQEGTAKHPQTDK